MKRDEFQVALADHIVNTVMSERNVTQFVYDAVVHGRTGITDMSNSDLETAAEMWDFEGKLDDDPVKPSDAPLISFVQNDVTNFNPFISECGRFTLEPSHFGFEKASTGGGYVAWIKQFDNGWQIWVVSQDETEYATGENTDVIGLFNDEGIQVDAHYLPMAGDVVVYVEGGPAALEVIHDMRRDFPDFPKEAW